LEAASERRRATPRRTSRRSAFLACSHVGLSAMNCKDRRRERARRGSAPYYRRAPRWHHHKGCLRRSKVRQGRTCRQRRRRPMCRIGMSARCVRRSRRPPKSCRAIVSCTKFSVSSTWFQMRSRRPWRSFERPSPALKPTARCPTLLRSLVAHRPTLLRRKCRRVNRHQPRPRPHPHPRRRRRRRHHHRLRRRRRRIHPCRHRQVVPRRAARVIRPRCAQRPLPSSMVW